MKLKYLIIIVVFIICAICIGCGGGGNTAVPSVNGSVTPASGSGGNFSITVHIPGPENMEAKVIPWQKKTLKVTVKHESVLTVIPPVTVDISGTGTYTATVADVPVGLNEAAIETLDVNDRLLAMRKQGFQMVPGGDVNAGTVIMGVSLDPAGSLHCDPNYIEIKKGEILYVENKDTGTDYTVTIGAESHSVSAATAGVPPVTAATFPAEAFSTFSGTVGTYSVTAGGSIVGNVVVYDTISISGFSPGAGDEGDAVTISGSFYSTPASTTVTFNGVSTPVLAGSDGTHLLVKVPSGATTGKISVTTPGGTVSSSGNFIVEPGFISLAGGTYTMGGSNVTPTHSVTLSPFYINKYEVTNNDYCAFLKEQITIRSEWVTVDGSNSDAYTGLAGNIATPSGITVKTNYETRPVVYVSWYGAVAYCNWLSTKNGLTPCYDSRMADSSSGYNEDPNTWRQKNGYRLPTEAEWEYACRGGSAEEYYWGDPYPPEPPNIGDYAWYYGNRYDSVLLMNIYHPVGQKTGNNYGLYDMSGNVLEWCSDWYGDYSSDAQTDPVGPGSGTYGSYRVLRGGSWGDYADYCLSAIRGVCDPSYRGDLIGFRPVRTK
ncbi:MAG: SUMF1/EgtB/PvdO family nonheme iron enzyme [Candidatus Eremiobacterota bacterium]